MTSRGHNGEEEGGKAGPAQERVHGSATRGVPRMPGGEEAAVRGTGDGHPPADNRAGLPPGRGVLPPELAGRLLMSPPVGGAVYFLMAGGECVYIGSSAKPAVRVGLHRTKEGRAFEAAMYLPIAIEDMWAEERRWISSVHPRHNKRHNPCPDPDSPSWGTSARPDRFFASSEMPVEVVAAIDERARQEGRSRSELMHIACLFYLEYAPVTPAEPNLPPSPDS